ncbi:MAG: VOC family protein [Rhodospirillaceae bacterium]|nr:VOC family protein [Rhodospirillaceae bacterium]
MPKAKRKAAKPRKLPKKLSVVPKGQSTPTAYLGVKDAKEAIKFYAKAFGAKELFRLTEPGGKIGHAEISIGVATLMLADEYPDFGCLSPQSIGGSPVQFHLYVKNADAAVKKAVKAGATLVRPVEQQFYGDRGGTVADPFGYKWMIAQRVEVVSPKEMQRRWMKMFTPGK